MTARYLVLLAGLLAVSAVNEVFAAPLQQCRWVDSVGGYEATICQQNGVTQIQNCERRDRNVAFRVL